MYLTHINTTKNCRRKIQGHFNHKYSKSILRQIHRAKLTCHISNNRSNDKKKRIPHQKYNLICITQSQKYNRIRTQKHNQTYTVLSRECNRIRILPNQECNKIHTKKYNQSCIIITSKISAIKPN